MRQGSIRLVITLAIGACSLPEPAPLPPDTFAFGVFGDGPYRAWENGRFRRVLEDAGRADLEWFLHVGDILWYPCSDEALAGRLEALNSLQLPVVYTPGDNEWADCHERIAGSYRPLERLAHLRSTFFADPGHSLGGRVMRLESQSEDPAFADYVENARWRRGGFLFATLHMVGSGNAMEPFEGRTSANNLESELRTRAALAWLEETFRIARSDGSNGVVLAVHGDPGLERDPDTGLGYVRFVDRLEERVKTFPGPVLLIHGDSHELRVDHPLTDSETGEPLANFTRLETFGSPDIGWVRVVVDTVAGRVVDCEPRLMPWWWLR